MGGIPTTFCLIISLRSPLALLLYLHPEVYYKATGTMSGKVFYLDSKSGEEIWSFETGSPLFRSSHHPIIPSINGSIYLYSEHGLKRHPMSVRDIVAHAPFSPGDGNIYLGSKQSHLFAIDPATGTVYNCHTSTASNQSVDCNGELPSGVVFLGRADYHIHALDENTGELRWNMSIGEYVSSARNLSLISDDTRFVSGVDGSLKLVDISSGNTLWSVKLPSPAIHVQPDTADGPVPMLVFQEQVALMLEGSNKVLVANQDTQLVAIETPSELPINDYIPLLESDPTKGSTDPAGDQHGNHDNLPITRHTCSPEHLHLCLVGLHPIVCDSKDETCVANPIKDIKLLPSPDDVDSTNRRLSWYSTWTTVLFGIIAAAVLLQNIVGLLNSMLKGKPMPLPGGELKGQAKSPKKSSKKLAAKKSSAKEKSKTKASDAEDASKKIPVIVDGKLRLGLLEVNLNSVLGYGSSGTVVYEGRLNGRKVAIKRTLKAFYSMADRETKLLIESDEHPNVVRYYATEEDSEFVYLALSYAHKSLDQLIDNENSASVLTASVKKDILVQLARGVHHLHKLNIVHRDLKPQNILVVNTAGGDIQAKITDMGLAKKLEHERNSFSTTAHGTVGWQAPEVLLRRKQISGEGSSSSSSSSNEDSDTPPSSPGVETDKIKMTKKIDIFSLGCVFYYVLTREHPFGDRISREMNVLNGNYKLVNIEPEAEDLISSMIAADPAQRPTTAEILTHPYFWSAEKKLNFLRDASDFLEREQPTAPIVLDFEHEANKSTIIPGRDWIPLLSKMLLTDLNRFRKYNSSKLRDLLRIIRNKAHHYRDLPEELQQTLGSLPDGYLQYFMSRFPKLFCFTYHFIKKRCKDDQRLSHYFQLTHDML